MTDKELFGNSEQLESSLCGHGKDHIADPNKMVEDLISRQTALDALGERPMLWINNDEYTLGARNQYDMDRLAIETVPSAQPTVYGYDVKELIVFADAVRKKGITEFEIHEFALNAKSAYEYAWEEFQRTQKEALDSVMRGDQT